MNAGAGPHIQYTLGHSDNELARLSFQNEAVLSLTLQLSAKVVKATTPLLECRAQPEGFRLEYSCAGADRNTASPSEGGRTMAAL